MNFHEPGLDIQPITEAELPDAERFLAAVATWASFRKTYLDADHNYLPSESGLDQAIEEAAYTALNDIFAYCAEFPLALPRVVGHIKNILPASILVNCIKRTIPAAKDLSWRAQQLLSYETLHTAHLDEEQSRALAGEFESQARAGSEKRILAELPSMQFDSWKSLQAWVQTAVEAEGVTGMTVDSMTQDVLTLFRLQLERVLSDTLPKLITAYQVYPADYPVHVKVFNRCKQLLRREAQDRHRFSDHDFENSALTVWEKEKLLWQEKLLPDAIDLYMDLMFDPELADQIQQRGKHYDRWQVEDYHRVLAIAHDRQADHAMARLPMDKLSTEDRATYHSDLYTAYREHRPAELMKSLSEFVAELQAQPEAERERLFLEHGKAAQYPKSLETLQRYICSIGEIIPHTTQVYAQLFREVSRCFLNSEAVFFTEEVMTALGLTTEQRTQLLQEVYDTYWMQYPDILLHKWIIDPERTQLRPDQITTLTERLKSVQSFNETRIEEFYRFPGTDEQNVGLAEAILSAKAELSPLALETLVGIYPAVCERVMQHTADFSAERLTQIIRLMLAGYLYSFEDNAGTASQFNQRNRELIVAVMDHLPGEVQAEVKPWVLVHAVDPDFSDMVQADRLAAAWQLPLPEQAALSDKERLTAALMRRIKTASPDRAQRLIEQYQSRATEITELRERSFVTINFSAQSLGLIVNNAGRLKATWDIPGRERYASRFANFRHVVEARLGMRGRGTENSPHPIYGAVAYEQGKHDKFGAAPDYGDCWFKLKSDVMQSRTSFTGADTYNIGSPDQVFAESEVAYLVMEKRELKIERSSYDYVEAQIHGGVALNDMSEIHIPRKDQATTQAALDIITTRYPDIKIVIEEVGASELKAIS